MKAYVGSRDLSPLILNLDPRCRQADNSDTGRWLGPSAILDILEKTKFSCACGEILVEKRATEVLCVFDLSRGCHTFRPSHLPCSEHPKIVRWCDNIFQFHIRQFPSKNLFVPLLKFRSSLEPNTVAVQHKYCYSSTKASCMFTCIMLLGFVPLVWKLPSTNAVQLNSTYPD